MKNQTLDFESQYWATVEDPELLVSHIQNKVKNYFEDVRDIGLMDLWERSYRAYYGGRVSNGLGNESLFQSSRLSRGGNQGQKTLIKVNHFRNLILHAHQLVTSNKPVTQCLASNTDYKSQVQTILSNGLLDYYWNEKNVSRFISDGAEIGLVYGEGYIHAPWNVQAGRQIETDETGRPMYEGDQEYEVLAPIDVIRDPSDIMDKRRWYILRGQENKWDLAVKNPAIAERILAQSPIDLNDKDNPTFQLRGGKNPENHDLIRTYTLYHDRCDTLPNGRLVIALEDVVIFDGPLPYDRVPVFRLTPRRLSGTIYGYSPAFDLLGVQEGIDELHTALMSNNKTFALQSIWVNDSDSVSITNLSGGMKLFKSAQKPEGIQLTQSAPETYNYLEILEKSAETLAGINSTVRGNPATTVESGTALALLVSQSIEFASSLEEEVYKLVEDVSMALICNLRDLTPPVASRIANIMGEANRPYAKEFTPKSDLDQINRVTVERVNPMSKTVAGRISIAENLMKNGMLTSPDQYIEVLQSGRLDGVLQPSSNKTLNIRAENEELRNGRPVMPVVTENHADHIKGHMEVINNPESKKNPALVQAVLDHITEHLNQWRSADPAILFVTGQQPPPPPMAPMGMAPPPGAGPQPGPGAPNPAAAPTDNPEQVSNVPVPGMPDLPPGSPPEAQAAYDQVK